MIRGVIFDVDGTLIISNDIHAKAWVDAFKECGHNVEFKVVRPLIGMGSDQLIPRAAPKLANSDEASRVSDHRSHVLERYIDEIKPAPGSRDLVQNVIAHGLKVVVASSSNKQALHHLLEIAQVDDLLTERTSADDVESSKPSPDPVMAALATLNVPANEAVMIGDSPHDIDSAGKCGVGVIAVRCGGSTDEELEGAIAIYDDPAELAAKYADSPLA